MKRYSAIVLCMAATSAWAMEKECDQASQPPQKKQRVIQSTESAFSAYVPAKREHPVDEPAVAAKSLLDALYDVCLGVDESSAVAGSSRAVEHVVVSMGYHKHEPLPGEMRVGPFACPWPGCLSDGLLTEKDLNAHIYAVHTPVIRYGGKHQTFFCCPDHSCKKGRSKKLSDLISHLRGVHALGGRPYVCAMCGCDFIRKVSCAIHIEGKHYEPECVCSCGQKFRYASHLLRHVRRYNGETE